MSVDNLVFLRDDRIPSVTQLQQALDDAGISIVIEPTDDLRSHTGYLPALFEGHPSGFEWYYGPAQEVASSISAERLGDRGHAVNFVTHSDMRELVCGLMVGAILAKLADGLVFHEETDALIDGNQALATARSIKATYL